LNDGLGTAGRIDEDLLEEAGANKVTIGHILDMETVEDRGD
jgi:hypothetical protein